MSESIKRHETKQNINHTLVIMFGNIKDEYHGNEYSWSFEPDGSITVWSFNEIPKTHERVEKSIVYKKYTAVKEIYFDLQKEVVINED